MALGTPTLLDSFDDTALASSYASPNSVTPTVGAVLFAYLYYTKGSAPDIPTSVTGYGLTFTRIGSGSEFEAGLGRQEWYYAVVGGSPTNAAITLNLATNHTGCQIHVVQIATGIDTTNPVVTSNVAVASAASGTTLTVTLPNAFGHADNGVLAGFSSGGTSTWTAGSGFTLLGAGLSGATPNRSTNAEYRLSNDTTADVTRAGGTATAFGGMAFEIRAAAFVDAAPVIASVSAMTVTAMASPGALATSDIASASVVAVTALASPAVFAVPVIGSQSVVSVAASVIAGNGTINLDGPSWVSLTDDPAPPLFEVSFETGPYEDPVWVDLTDHGVKQLSLHHSRGTVLGQWEAAQVNATLNDHNRELEPHNTASSHYPNVKPRRHARFRSAYGTPIVDFYINRFRPHWPANEKENQQCLINGFDAFQLWATRPLLHPYEAIVMSRSPRGYYRLQDAPTAFPAVMRDISGNNRHGTYVAGSDAISFGPSMVHDDLGARANMQPLGALLQFPAALFPEPPWVLEFLLSPYLNLYYDVFTIEGPSGVIMRGQLNPHLSVMLNPAVANVQATIRPGRINMIHIRNSGTFMWPYLNGVNWGSVAVPTDALSAGLVLRLGNQRAITQPAWLASAAVDRPWFAVGEIALYAQDMSIGGGQIPEQYAALDALDGQLPGERQGYILDQAGWSPALRDLAPGQVSMGPASAMGGQRVLEALKECEATEAGNFLVAPDGKAMGRDHYAPWFTNVRSIVQQRTFGNGIDEEGRPKLGYRSLTLAEDDEVTANRIQVTWAHGGSVVVTNLAGVAEFEVIEFPTHSAARFIEQLDGQAEWLAWFLQHPGTARIESITTMLTNSDQEDWLALQPLDRVLIEWQPPSGGSLVSSEGLVSGRKLEIAPAGWQMTLETIAVPPPLALWEWEIGAFGSTTTLGWGKGDV